MYSMIHFKNNRNKDDTKIKHLIVHQLKQLKR